MQICLEISYSLTYLDSSGGDVDYSALFGCETWRVCMYACMFDGVSVGVIVWKQLSLKPMFEQCSGSFIYTLCILLEGLFNIHTHTIKHKNSQCFAVSHPVQDSHSQEPKHARELRIAKQYSRPTRIKNFLKILSFQYLKNYWLLISPNIHMLSCICA